MDILAARARIALASLTPPPLRALALAPALAPLPGALPLHRRLTALLAQLCDEGAVGAGVQVCVMRRGAVLAEGCAGFRGIVDPRGMRTDVPMPLLELSALLPVLALHALIGSGAASFDTPISPEWPGCKAVHDMGTRLCNRRARFQFTRLQMPRTPPSSAAEATRSTVTHVHSPRITAADTIGDALAHRVPIDGASSWRQSAESLAALPTQLAALDTAPLRESVAPSSTVRATSTVSFASSTSSGHAAGPTPRTTAMSGSSAASSYADSSGRAAPRSSGMAHGTLLAGIISGVAGKPYGEILRTLLLEPSGLAGTLHGGELPEDVAAEVASVSSGFAAQLQNLGATFSDGLPEHSDGGSGDGRSGTDGTEGSNGADGSDGGDGTATDPPKVGGDAGGSAAADGAPRSSEGRLTGLAGMADAFSHELPLNAGVVNAEALRAGCAPGIGAFGSARDV